MEAEQAENAAAISAHNAQVWAEGGTLQDTDGGDDPDGPRDGAKQLAEKAEEAKELAVQAAASAAGAQANAAQAAQEASTRANQAQQSASAADSSRAAAETAAGDAKASETSAAAREEAAKTSETNAKASETAAEESAAEAEAAQEAAERARAAVENMQVQAQTLEPGTDATVTKTVENGVVKLLYGIPEGKQGPQGPPGSAVTATGLWGVDIKNGDLILTYTGDDIPPLSIKDGDLIYTLDGNEINLGHVVGRDSQTPSITVGQVETLPAGSHVTASITGETPNLVLNLGIPEGKQGEPGQAATIEIVETETVSSDAPAAMVELPDSTPQARRYKAQVPQGIQGPAGLGVPSTEGIPENYVLTPSGWKEPQNGGENWDYHNRISLAEDVASVKITPDKPLKKLLMLVYTQQKYADESEGTKTGGTHQTVRLNGDSKGVFYGLFSSSSFSKFVKSRIELEIIKGNLVGTFENLPGSASGGYQMTGADAFKDNLFPEYGTINSVTLAPEYKFIAGIGNVGRYVAGSTFEIWGVYA